MGIPGPIHSPPRPGGCGRQVREGGGVFCEAGRFSWTNKGSLCSYRAVAVSDAWGPRDPGEVSGGETSQVRLRERLPPELCGPRILTLDSVGGPSKAATGSLCTRKVTFVLAVGITYRAELLEKYEWIVLDLCRPSPTPGILLTCGVKTRRDEIWSYFVSYSSLKDMIIIAFIVLNISTANIAGSVLEEYLRSFGC